jgi:hypothetical protein
VFETGLAGSFELLKGTVWIQLFLRCVLGHHVRKVSTQSNSVSFACFTLFFTRETRVYSSDL